MKTMKKAPGVLALVLLVVGASCSNDGDATTDTASVDTTLTAYTNTTDPTTTEVAATDPTTTVDDEIVRITVTVGIDSGPDRIEEVSVGDSIELTMVNPDEDDEFHVHGFDLGGDETPAGEEKTFAFTATETGDFEVESHATGEVLVVIRVS